LADAVSVAQGKTQAVCRCDIYVVRDDERKLCAVAQGTIRKIEK
jgi:acyl-coenzyme A thioesterase PaaI-like protein